MADLGESDSAMTASEQARRFLDVQKMHATTADAARRVFDSPDGKIVLAWLARESGMLSTTVAVDADGHTDAEMTLINEGKRILFLTITMALRWTEGEILALAQERTRDQIARQHEGG